jgi:hypothetical protein
MISNYDLVHSLLPLITNRVRQLPLVIHHAGVVEYIEKSAACRAPEKSRGLGEGRPGSLNAGDLAASDGRCVACDFGHEMVLIPTYRIARGPLSG